MVFDKSCWIAVVAACFAAAGPSAAQDVDAGRTIAEKLCARCHAIRSGEKSKHGLAPSFPVIAGRYSVWQLQEALAEGIVVGHPDMPKFVFTPRDIDNLLSYMDTFTRMKGQAK
jgi:mono/diheme cytochrome c family protein